MRKSRKPYTALLADDSQMLLKAGAGFGVRQPTPSRDLHNSLGHHRGQKVAKVPDACTDRSDGKGPTHGSTAQWAGGFFAITSSVIAARPSCSNLAGVSPGPEVEGLLAHASEHDDARE